MIFSSSFFIIKFWTRNFLILLIQFKVIVSKYLRTFLYFVLNVSIQCLNNGRCDFLVYVQVLFRPAIHGPHILTPMSIFISQNRNNISSYEKLRKNSTPRESKVVWTKSNLTWNKITNWFTFNVRIIYFLFDVPHYSSYSWVKISLSKILLRSMMIFILQLVLSILPTASRNKMGQG